MNTFHLLMIALENKDKNKAMLLLKDCSDSVARKILLKAGISVPDYRGKAFWYWIQQYIIKICVPERTAYDCKKPSADGYVSPASQAESRCAGPGENSGSAGNDTGSYQHSTPSSVDAGTVRRRTNGVPTVRCDLGSKRLPESNTAPAPREPSLAVGTDNPASVFPCFSGHGSLVRLKYPLCLRRCHAAPGPALSSRLCRPRGWPPDTGINGISSDACQLWPAGDHSGRIVGSVFQRNRMVSSSGSSGSWSRPVFAQRSITSVRPARSDSGLRNTSDDAAAANGHSVGRSFKAGV